MQVALGQVLHQIDELEFANSNIPLDDLLAVALLLFFGVKTILVRCPNQPGKCCLSESPSLQQSGIFCP